MPPQSAMDMAQHVVTLISNQYNSANKIKALGLENLNLDRYTPNKNTGTVEKFRHKKEEKASKEYKYLPILPEQDLSAVRKSVEMLAESFWYFSDYCSADAKTHLANMAIGTFLVRDSSDPNYLFSLSVKTERGATSVRIKYARGLFQFDCEDTIRKKLPKFENVVELVDFHVTLCNDDTASHCRWLEHSGRRDLAVKLKKPCLSGVPSLKHISRVATNRTLKDLHFPQRSSELLPIPDSIKTYLQQYPYKV